MFRSLFKTLSLNTISILNVHFRYSSPFRMVYAEAQYTGLQSFVPNMTITASRGWCVSRINGRARIPLRPGLNSSSNTVVLPQRPSSIICIFGHRSSQILPVSVLMPGNHDPRALLSVLCAILVPASWMTWTIMTVRKTQHQVTSGLNRWCP